MKTKITNLAFSLIVMLFTFQANAQQSLVEWRLSQKYVGVALGANDYLNGQENTVPSNYQALGAKPSELIRGSGLNATKGRGNSFAAGFEHTTNTSYANAVTNNAYMEFAVRPETAKLISFSTVAVRIQSNQPTGTGNATLYAQLAYDLNSSGNFTPIGSSNAITVQNTSTDFTIDVSALGTINATSKVTFRLYYYRPNTTNTTAYVAIGRKEDAEVATFSSLTVSGTVTNDGTLPISLTSFSAKPKLNGNLLQWATSAETNNKGFELYRSTDGNNYNFVGAIEGKGNSNTANTYTYTDKFYGNAYYKLTQIDYNGAKTEYFTYAKAQAEPVMILAPSNQSSILEVIVAGLNTGKGRLTIYNLNGQKLYQENLALTGTNQRFNINFKGNVGLYLAVLEADDVILKKKFIK
ncbi:T9SS type A sorting domain-containing protein [Pedobacter sp.]